MEGVNKRGEEGEEEEGGGGRKENKGLSEWKERRGKCKSEWKS